MATKRPMAISSLGTRMSAGMFSIAVCIAFLAVIFGYATALRGYQALIGIMASLLAALVWLKPKVGFVVFWLSLFTIGPGFSTGMMVGPFHLNLMDVLLAVFIGFRLAQAVIRRASLWRRPNSTSIALLAFLTVALLVGIFQNPFLDIAKDLRPFLYLFLVWFWTASSGDGEELGRILAYVFAAGSMGALIKALMITAELIPGDYPLDVAQVMTVTSPELGGERLFIMGADTLCTVAVPYILACTLGESFRKHFGFLLAGLVCALLVLTLTFTRATWLGTALGIVVVIWLYSYLRKADWQLRRLIVIFLLMAGLMLTGTNVVIGDAEFPITTLILRRLSGDYELGGGLYGLWRFRVEETRELLRSWMQSPIFGKGLGGTYKHLLFSAGVWDYQLWTHNGWLWLLLKGGLIGVALFLYPFLRLARRALQLLRKEYYSDRVPLIVGLLSAGLAFGVLSITNNRFASPEGGAFLGLWLGLMGNVTRIERSHE